MAYKYVAGLVVLGVVGLGGYLSSAPSPVTSPMTPAQPMAESIAAKSVSAPIGSRSIKSDGSPDFKVNAVLPVTAAAGALSIDAAAEDAALAQKEQALKALIGEYNAVLNDPVAKKRLEQQYQALSADYKKAVLAKVKREK